MEVDIVSCLLLVESDIGINAEVDTTTNKIRSNIFFIVLVEGLV